MVRVLKRSELEEKLKALGWSPTGVSGKNHTVWTHPRKSHKLVVPIYDLIYDSNAEGILTDAER
jgi:predicted RNA binding protein YcfA (HicA-like mRNA interferase family)